MILKNISNITSQQDKIIKALFMIPESGLLGSILWKMARIPNL